MSKDTHIIHIMFGKDILDLHIKQFWICNGCWSCSVTEKDGEKYLSFSNNPLRKDTELDYLISIEEYEHPLYEDLFNVKEKIDNCMKELYGENGCVTRMKNSGYNDEIIQQNVIVKKQTTLLERLKKEKEAIEEEISLLERVGYEEEREMEV